ncbi:MAG: DUF177 domain-containing protein [Gammaproteobacteria bacterium]|nr:DUF177 domain-containing protein [Gammaproteobacteria bacterium]
MSGASGEFLDLTRASHQPVQWTGSISLGALSRLATAIAHNSGLVAVDLSARYDGDQVVVQGAVEATLMLSCQRCFAEVELPVKSEFTLAWVRSETQAAELPESYEPLLSASGRVKIADLVEDELLLALPLAVLHKPPHPCAVTGASDTHLHEAIDTRSKPFAALKQMKRG